MLCPGCILAGSPLFRPVFGFVSANIRKVLQPPSTQVFVVTDLVLDNFHVVEVAEENAGVIRINDLERVINYTHRSGGGGERGWCEEGRKVGMRGEAVEGE